MSRFVRLLLIFSLFICLVSSAYATVTGTVLDTDGEPVSGALVTFTNESDAEQSYTTYTDESGFYEIDMIPTSVDEDQLTSFSLGQNYPNPFNPTTTIPFYLYSSAHVTLSVYNVMGQKVATLIDHSMNPGHHSVSWDGMDDYDNHVGAGIYFYQLRSETFMESGKMLLLDGGNSIDVGAFADRGSNDWSRKSTAKISNSNLYGVTITRDSTVLYEEAGITLVPGQILDFILSFSNSNPYDINGMTFVFIPGGTFEMGDVENAGPSNEKPAHTVTVSDFDMSIYTVTNIKYAKYLTVSLSSGDISVSSSSVIGATGEWEGQEYIDLADSSCEINYSNGTFWVEPGKENRPVVFVTWYGAKSFATFYGLDLPTEAEWEYACRGGRQNMYGTDDGTISHSKANYNPSDGLADVGSYPANPFGLYDMSGNVYEWCHDWFGDYSSEAAFNPTGAQSGSCHSTRGGGFRYGLDRCRSSERGYSQPSDSFDFVGFRVVRRASLQQY